jgi:hypothetical protein
MNTIELLLDTVYTLLCTELRDIRTLIHMSSSVRTHSMPPRVQNGGYKVNGFHHY